MKQKHLFTTAVTVIVLLLAAVPSQASTVSYCMELIDVLANETAGVEFLSRNAARDEASLLGKLERARMKLDQGKFADAIQKLDDFIAAVVSMRDAAKPKISSGDAALLIEGAEEVIACIQLLG